MSFDYYYLNQLKKNNPAWRLLQADHAPLIASFLHKAFIQTNERILAQSQLVSILDDVLFQLKNVDGAALFSKSALSYLDDWSQNNKGWLRKFYPQGSDEPHYDLTPTTEKALVWLENLAEKSFVGTESRLLIIFELLRQIAHGVETDVEVRIAELEKKKRDIDKEIQSLHVGDLAVMDDAALKDRFFQVQSTARELLSDFRTVEHNFRVLDRDVREQIASWDGSKGQLLQQIFGERDAISDSAQGRSFRAFWDFLMSPASQDELSALLQQVTQLESLAEFVKDTRLQRIHFDWLEAGEYTQRTVAKLSQQLRRFLDDQAYLENKRIIQILDRINLHALQVKSCPPKEDFMNMDEASPALHVPMGRPLFTPPTKVKLQTHMSTDELDNIVSETLYNQMVVDKEELMAQIKRARGLAPQISLAHVIQTYPLEHGLAELVTYLSIAANDKHAVFDEDINEVISWFDEQGIVRQASLPRIIFTRT
ncbi:DUF3375 domain-containing protein [Legionella sp. 16cNR16C]|uniref:DUF3375 domain-containing protein n=1 Tax=Legionella sp. 16cNR16C TaxID=2905656 RepID=UPI001E3993A2|nr:DUF3375 domain-containing protein [Legionella sp. 16cNR16C]MCE3045208.1 DUF3375 domain-containing protein [Legionella sp. 16cNR16C]